MAEEAIRTMQQQLISALDGLTRHNSELQAELVQIRQQSANEVAGLWQEVRAPQLGSQTTGVGVDTAAGKARRLLGRSRCVARLARSVQGLVWSSGATTAEDNATILEEDDRAASAQLYRMMLMICKGAALNIVFLAGEKVSRLGNN